MYQRSGKSGVETDGLRPGSLEERSWARLGVMRRSDGGLHQERAEVGKWRIRKVILVAVFGTDLKGDQALSGCGVWQEEILQPVSILIP